MNPCERCGRPVADTGYVDHRCAAELAAALRQGADLGAEIAVTVARLDRHGPGGRSADVPLALAWEAADAAWAVRNTLGTWARIVHEEHGAPLPTWPRLRPLPEGVEGPRQLIAVPDRRPTTIMAWLAGHVGWLRMQQHAAEAFDELHDVVRTLRRTVDSPPALWYAGPCWQPDEEGTRCAQEMYAVTEARTVRCRQCGTEHDADERKAWLIAQARDVDTYAGHLASALAALGYEIPAGTIRSWAHRDELTQRGEDGKHRPLYRVGDVLDLAERAAEARRLKELTKARVSATLDHQGQKTVR